MVICRGRKDRRMSKKSTKEAALVRRSYLECNMKDSCRALDKKKYHSVLSDADNFEIKRGQYDPETGQVKTWRTNERFIESAKQKIMSDPDIVQAINDPDEGQENLEALNQILDLYKISEAPRPEAASASERKAWETKNLTPEQKRIKERTGSTVSEDIANIHSYVDSLVTSAFAGDRRALS